jgi:hypothetical protein
MGVDKTGENKALRVFQDTLGGKAVGELLLGPHCHDMSSPDRHGAWSEDLILMVHGEHPGSSK